LSGRRRARPRLPIARNSDPAHPPALTTEPSLFLAM